MNKHTALLLSILSSVGMHLGAQPVRPDRRPSEPLTRMAEQVRKKLVMLANYSVFDAITFSLAPSPSGFKLTLRGYAARPTLKDSAGRAVEKLEGIEAVDNKIEVLPLSRHDDTIRLAAYLKIYHHPALSRYNPSRGAPAFGSPMAWRRAQTFGISNDPPPGVHPISIIVKHGNITLIGLVDNTTDKRLAGMLAGQVPGAFQVTNELMSLQKPKAK